MFILVGKVSFKDKGISVVPKTLVNFLELLIIFLKMIKMKLNYRSYLIELITVI